MSTQDGILEEGSASASDDLRGDLTAAFDASAADSGDQGGDKGADKTPQGGDVSEAARTLAAARKAAADTGDKGTLNQDDPAAKRQAELAAMSPEDRAKAETEDKTNAETTSAEAPQHWPARDREFFAKQSPDVKSWMLGRHKAMEADYTRRVQEVAHVRRESDELKEIFKPFADAMASDGMTIPQAVRQLAAAHQKLVSDPVNGIHWLAQKYGIDLKQAADGSTQQGQLDPNVRMLQEKIAQLEAGFNGQRSAQQEQEQKANLSKVEQFAEEKDAQGQLLRPHFDDVAKDISMLLRAARDAGEQLSLQDAYDRAIYANPNTRQKVLAAKDAERQAKETEERTRKANAARNAGFDVKGEGAATSVAAKTDSIRGDLEAAFAQHGGRV